MVQRTRAWQKAEAFEKEKRRIAAAFELYEKDYKVLLEWEGPPTEAAYLRKREEFERTHLLMPAEERRRMKRREARMRAADRKWGATSDPVGRPLWSGLRSAGGSGALPAGRGRGQGRGAGSQQGC